MTINRKNKNQIAVQTAKFMKIKNVQHKDGILIAFAAEKLKNGYRIYISIGNWFEIFEQGMSTYFERK